MIAGLTIPLEVFLSLLGFLVVLKLEFKEERRTERGY